MAANFCSKCGIPWPIEQDTFIGWHTRRDYTRKCVACLGPLEERHYQSPLAQDKAIRTAGWAEFVRRETRREKRRIEKGKPSPEELGRRDAALHFEDQEALRRDLEIIRNLPEGDPGMVMHRRHWKFNKDLV